MKSINIFLSENENFYGSALKIKKQSKLNTNIIYIEKFINFKKLDLISKGDIVYFLCNTPLIIETIKLLDQFNCYIINKDFFLNNYKKKEVQELLYKKNIKVPEIISVNKFNNEKFPLFCKENTHAGITFQAYSESTLIKFFDKFDKNNFYLERTIVDEKLTRELKFYYIKGAIFRKDDEKEFVLDVDEDCKKISKYLNNLEVFSIDFIKTSKCYHIIDINPSAGFYLSNDARKDFINYVKKLK